MSTTNNDQQEIVDALTGDAGRCLGPWPPDLDDSPAERLDTFVFALFPELEGAANMPQMYLAPKLHPDVNLVDHDMHDTWPDFTEADNPFVRAFILAILFALREAQVLDVDLRKAMGRLGVAVCRVIEDGYELRAQHFGEDDEASGLGPDVAPGLADAFRAAWGRR